MLQGQIDYCAAVNSTCSHISFHVLLVSSQHLFLCLFLHSVGLSWCSCSCSVSTSCLSLSQLSLLRLFTFCWLLISQCRSFLSLLELLLPSAIFVLEQMPTTAAHLFVKLLSSGQLIVYCSRRSCCLVWTCASMLSYIYLF